MQLGCVGGFDFALMPSQLLGVSLRATRDTTKVMLGVSLRARYDTTLVIIIIIVLLIFDNLNLHTGIYFNDSVL